MKLFFFSFQFIYALSFPPFFQIVSIDFKEERKRERINLYLPTTIKKEIGKTKGSV